MASSSSFFFINQSQIPPFHHQSQEKEEREAKKKQNEAEAAKVYEQFVASFDADDDDTKVRRSCRMTSPYYAHIEQRGNWDD